MANNVFEHAYKQLEKERRLFQDVILRNQKYRKSFMVTDFEKILKQTEMETFVWFKKTDVERIFNATVHSVRSEQAKESAKHDHTGDTPL